MYSGLIDFCSTNNGRKLFQEATGGKKERDCNKSGDLDSAVPKRVQARLTRGDQTKHGAEYAQRTERSHQVHYRKAEKAGSGQKAGSFCRIGLLTILTGQILPGDRLYASL